MRPDLLVVACMSIDLCAHQVCACVHVSVCVGGRVSAYVQAHLCVPSVKPSVFVCMGISGYGCVLVSMCVFVCLCTCVYVFSRNSSTDVLLFWDGGRTGGIC